MPKFTFVLVIVALAVSVQGFPTSVDDVAAAAAAGNWAKVHEILRKKFNFKPYQGIDFGTDVRSLKPSGGGHIYAEAESSFQHSSNINGHVDQESGGHKIVNSDGTVKEWDFKP